LSKVFQIGDLVEAIDDTIKGVVVSIQGNLIRLETTDGFELEFTPDQLIKLDQPTSLKISNYEAAQVKRQKEIPAKRGQNRLKPKERNAPRMEVDLHIHQLTDSTKGMSNFDMLNLQMETAKRQLEFAIKKRIQKVVFIHGVGEGVLKEELKYLFGRYDNLKFYDADYQKYGLGATEVYIYQNS